MSDHSSVVRTANSLSLAAWFGGSLMGLTGRPRGGDRPTFEDDGGNRGYDQGSSVPAEGSAWSTWQPVQAGAIASQLASGAVLTFANRGRGRRGGAGVSAVRVALTGAAIGATALAARSGRQLEQAPDDGSDTAGMERRTRALQVAVPVLTGTLIALESFTGEQHRSGRMLRGTAQRVLPDAIAGRLAA